MSAADNLSAINVCIIPPAHIVDVALRAATRLCDPLKGTAHYYTLAPIDTAALVAMRQQQLPPISSTPQHGFPHCTLYQLFAKKEEIGELSVAVTQIVADTIEKLSPASSSSTTLTCEGALSPGPIFGATDDQQPIHVPSIVITNTGVVKALHEAIVEGLRGFHTTAMLDADADVTSASSSSASSLIPFYQSTFNKEWPANEASAQWTLNFEQNASFKNYFPHITLGACVGKPEGARLCMPPPSTVHHANAPSAAEKPKEGGEEGGGGGLPIPFDLRECVIVVSEMANNCCCYKVLDVITTTPASIA